MVTQQIRIGSVENRYALTRLADKARTDGIRLYRDPVDGRHYASSASEPGRLHYVTGYSCDCRGFMTHQRCKHHAALLAAMGWLTDKPEPDPPGATLRIHRTGDYYDDRGFYVDPSAVIFVSGVARVRLEGDGHELRTHWFSPAGLPAGIAPETPRGMTHEQAVEHWASQLAQVHARRNVHGLLQAASIFTDDREVA